MLRFSAALLLAAAGAVHAADPHVWFETDAGPIVLKLDAQRAPLTTQHITTVVDEGYYNGQIFHRTIRNFMIQAGQFDGNWQVKSRAGTVASERNNGRVHEPGTIAIALPSGANNQPSFNAGTTEFFINTARNTNLDGLYTVFGDVVQGMPVVLDIGNRPSALQNGQALRPAQILRAVSSDGFPIMNLHTGAWYDPANSGRGFSIEIAHPAGAEQLGPLLVVYWYDYFEGRQVWITGVKKFEYGASEVTVPLQVSEGGEFGSAYDPATVSFDNEFGSLTIRFSACNRGHFSYDTRFGSGELELQRLTVPGNNRCD